MLATKFLKSGVFASVFRETVDACSILPRRLASTAPQVEVFHVQDMKDFDERVKNSKVPVIVDFFAT